MLPLLGVLAVAAGFLLRFNPLVVVVLAAFVAGLAGGLSPLGVLDALGRAYNENRLVALVWLVLPVIGVLERQGLQARARTLVARLKGASPGRILLGYFVARQLTAALGLTALGGQAQMVRPLIAPMAEGAAEARDGPLDPTDAEGLRAQAAAVDNIAVFFGEDIFIAMGSVLLIKGVLDHEGAAVEPLRLSMWAIPTAGLALLIHGARLLWGDRTRRRRAAAGPRA